MEQKGKPLALAVETSGRTGSAALGSGDNILAHETLSGHLRHGAELFACCQSLLDRVGGSPSDIADIYITAGPGSFTGIRIAVTMAKTLSFANGTKIVSISTMDVLSANVEGYISNTGRNIQQLATILDAKRGQFFVAVFQRTGHRWIKTVDDCLVTPSEFLKTVAHSPETTWLTGEGLVYYKDVFTAPNIAFLDEEYWYPYATNVYKLAREQARTGNFADPAKLVPAYIRTAGAIPKAR